MYNYNPYGQYAQQYNMANNYLGELQQMRERIDKQIQQAQQQTQQPQMVPQNQPTNLTQNFQLAPQTNNNNELESKYAENIDEVKNTFVMKMAIFTTKDFSTMWVKDVSGNIKTYRTEEIVEPDEKDLQIKALQDELNNMKVLMAQTMQEATPKATPKTTPKTIKK